MGEERQFHFGENRDGLSRLFPVHLPSQSVPGARIRGPSFSAGWTFPGAKGMPTSSKSWPFAFMLPDMAARGTSTPGAPDHRPGQVTSRRHPQDASRKNARRPARQPSIRLSIAAAGRGFPKQTGPSAGLQGVFSTGKDWPNSYDFPKSVEAGTCGVLRGILFYYRDICRPKIISGTIFPFELHEQSAIAD